MPKFISSKFHQQKNKLQNPYLEKHLQGKIGRFIKDNIKKKEEGGVTSWQIEINNHACEVKLVTGGTLAFSKFEDQQLPSLLKVKHGGMYYKLTDASMGCKPFDYFLMQGNAFVACQFWKKIQQEIVYFLDIDRVIKIKNSGAKSIKEEDFAKFGEKINLVKYK